MMSSEKYFIVMQFDSHFNKSSVGEDGFGKIHYIMITDYIIKKLIIIA